MSLEAWHGVCKVRLSPAQLLNIWSLRVQWLGISLKFLPQYSEVFHVDKSLPAHRNEKNVRPYRSDDERHGASSRRARFCG